MSKLLYQLYEEPIFPLKYRRKKKLCGLHIILILTLIPNSNPNLGFTHVGVVLGDKLGKLLEQLNEELLGFPQDPCRLGDEETKVDPADHNLIADLVCNRKVLGQLERNKIYIRRHSGWGIWKMYVTVKSKCLHWVNNFYLL